MKLSSLFCSRDCLLKQIEKRNAKRIAEYTRISTAFHPEDSQIIKDNIESISRYAKRKNINLEFVPDIKTNENKMKLYRRDYTYIPCPDNPQQILPIPVTDFKGEATLPKALTKEELITAIKTEASKILYSEKTKQG